VPRRRVQAPACVLQRVIRRRCVDARIPRTWRPRRRRDRTGYPQRRVCTWPCSLAWPRSGRLASIAVREDNRPGGRVHLWAGCSLPRTYARATQLDMPVVLDARPAAAPHQPDRTRDLAVQLVAAPGPGIGHVPLQPAVTHRRTVGGEAVLVPAASRGGPGHLGTLAGQPCLARRAAIALDQRHLVAVLVAHPPDVRVLAHIDIPSATVPLASR